MLVKVWIRSMTEYKTDLLMLIIQKQLNRININMLPLLTLAMEAEQINYEHLVLHCSLTPTL